MRVGVLASGSGTILQAMLDRKLPIVVVLADRPCGALGIAENAGIGAELVERTDFGSGFDRVAYTKEVVAALERHDVDLVAIAGFGTILSEPLRRLLRRACREHASRAAARVQGLARGA